MGKKGKIGIFVLACVVIGVTLFGFSQKEQKESYSRESVLDSLWEEFNVYSVQKTQYDVDHPITSIIVFDEKDIIKVESYLEEHLSEEDLDHYQFDVNQYSEKLDSEKPYSTEKVVDSLWDKFSVQSTQYGDESSVMSITVYNEKDINKVENYLEEHLSKEDLDHYKLNVYEWSADVGELRDNAQENLDSDDFNSDN